jgi:hypothetical protein
MLWGSTLDHPDHSKYDTDAWRKMRSARVQLVDVACAVGRNVDILEANVPPGPERGAQIRKMAAPLIERAGNGAAIHAARKAVETRLKELDDALQIPRPQHPDAVAVGQDVRRHVASLPASGRMKWLLDNAGDVAVAAAIVHAPPSILGLTADQHAAFVAAVRHARNPEAAREHAALGRIWQALQDDMVRGIGEMIEYAGLRRNDKGEWRHKSELEPVELVTPAAAE